MLLFKKLMKFSLVGILGTVTVGCASHQAVPGAYYTPKAMPILAGTGATAGAIAGASAGGASGLPIGVAIGGAAGGVMGYFADRPSAILSKLAQQGVQVVSIGQSLKLIIPTDACFDFGTSELTAHCENILNNTAAFLKKTGNAPINVAGYTDNIMDESIAQRLSQTQADSVVAFLWAHGIPQQRFQAKGYGSANPIATNYTNRGNKMNRRIEISL